MARLTVKTLTEDESFKLVKFFNDEIYNSKGPCRASRNYAMILMMLDAGLRVGEIAILETKCVRFAGVIAKSVTVTKEIAKTGVERIIPMTDRLQHALRNLQPYWLDTDITPVAVYCFPGSSFSLQMTTRQIQRILTKASLRSIDRPVSPHALRHTFATRLMKITSIRIVQQLLGHAQLSSTQVYTHPNSEDLSTAITAMAVRSGQ